MITSTQLLIAGLDNKILNKDWESELLLKKEKGDHIYNRYTKAEVRTLLNVYIEKLDELRQIVNNHEHNGINDLVANKFYKVINS